MMALVLALNAARNSAVSMLLSGGGSADHGDLALRIEIEGVTGAVLRGNRIAQRLGAPGDGVLNDAGGDGGARGFLQLNGRLKIREALGQVDGAVAGGEPGHLADNRFDEAASALTAETRAAHERALPFFLIFAGGLGGAGGSQGGSGVPAYNSRYIAALRSTICT